MGMEEREAAARACREAVVALAQMDARDWEECGSALLGTLLKGVEERLAVKDAYRQVLADLWWALHKRMTAGQWDLLGFTDVLAARKPDGRWGIGCLGSESEEEGDGFMDRVGYR